jgi:hypothetical protein
VDGVFASRVNHVVGSLALAPCGTLGAVIAKHDVLSTTGSHLRAAVPTFLIEIDWLAGGVVAPQAPEKEMVPPAGFNCG